MAEALQPQSVTVSRVVEDAPANRVASRALVRAVSGDVPWLTRRQAAAAPLATIGTVMLQVAGTVLYVATTLLLVAFGRQASGDGDVEVLGLPLGNARDLAGVAGFLVPFVGLTALGAAAWAMAERVASRASRQWGRAMRRKCVDAVARGSQAQWDQATLAFGDDRASTEQAILRVLSTGNRVTQLAGRQAVLTVAPLSLLIASAAMIVYVSPLLVVIVTVPTALIYLLPLRAAARRQRIVRDGSRRADEAIRRESPRSPAEWSTDTSFTERLESADEWAHERVILQSRGRNIALVAFGVAAGILMAAGLALDYPVADLLGCVLALRLLINAIVQLGGRLSGIGRAHADIAASKRLADIFSADLDRADRVTRSTGTESVSLAEATSEPGVLDREVFFSFDVAGEVIDIPATGVLLALCTGNSVRAERASALVRALEDTGGLDDRHQVSRSLRSRLARVAVWQDGVANPDPRDDRRAPGDVCVITTADLASFPPLWESCLTIVMTPINQRVSDDRLAAIAQFVDGYVIAGPTEIIAAGQPEDLLQGIGSLRALSRELRAAT